MALAGVAVNVCLAAVKIVAGLVGHSYALVADGVESTLDVFGSLLIWVGLKFAARPPDDTHPYGHGKAEPIAAIAVSLLLLLAAAGLAAQSIREIITPHHAPAPFTLVVLVLVIVVKEALFRTVLTAGNEIESSAVRTDAWHHRSDAITSAAAFLGIGVALLGGDGYEAADDWAALAACGIIAWNGWRMLLPALNEALDVAPPTTVSESIRSTALAVAGVMALDQCRVRKMGLDLYVDLHVIVDGALTVRAGHEIAHQVKDAIRAEHPSVADVLVHIEPSAE